MRKTIFILLVVSGWANANGPMYRQKEPLLQAEIENIYHDIQNVPNGIFKQSSMTVNGITADSATINSLTVGSINGTIAGTVKQIKLCSTSTNVTVTAATWTDTTLTCSITPTSSTSKILILVSQNLYMRLSNAGEAPTAGVKLLRDSTVMNTWPYGASNDTQTSTSAFSAQCDFTHLDSPATTSSITYKTQGENTNAVGTVRYQVGGLVSSEMILAEIAQ